MGIGWHPNIDTVVMAKSRWATSGCLMYAYFWGPPTFDPRISAHRDCHLNNLKTDRGQFGPLSVHPIIWDTAHQNEIQSTHLALHGRFREDRVEDPGSVRTTEGEPVRTKPFHVSLNGMCASARKWPAHSSTSMAHPSHTIRAAIQCTSG